MEDIEAKAKEYARVAHAGKVYGDNQNYFEAHLTKVADIVASVTDDPEVIAMAWLHDILEDTSFRDLYGLFGLRISDGVICLTRYKEYKSREKNEEVYIKKLSVAPPEVKLVKLADIIVNISNLSTKKGDKKFYLREKLTELQSIGLESIYEVITS